MKRSPARSSNRHFGLMLACIFFAIALFIFDDTKGLQRISVALGGVCVVITIFFPHLLSKMNWLWTQFGLGLGKLLNPIALLMLYIAIITPVGLCARMLGRDTLRLNFVSTDTYWIYREADDEPAERLSIERLVIYPR